MKYGLLREEVSNRTSRTLVDMFAESNVDAVVMETLHRSLNTLLSKKEL